MADRRRIVTIARDGTVTTVRDIEDAAVFFAVKDSFTVTPGPRKTVMAQVTRRYGGAQPAAETHDNGTIAWKILVVGTTADNVLANVEAILGNLETANQRLWLEWRPDGATNSTYYEMRGPATWKPTYSWAQFMGAKSMYVDVELPVGPLAWGDKQTITLPLYIQRLTNGSVETDLSGWAVASGAFTDPTAISGLAAWYKADTVAGNDGDAIGTWADQSGNGRDLTQATGAAKPLLKKAANGINSVNVLRFDGVNDYMSFVAGADWLTGTGITVLAVERRISAVASAATLSLVANGAASDFDNTGSALIGYQGGGGTGGVILADYRNTQRSSVAHPGNAVAFQETHLFDAVNDTVFTNGTGGTPAASTGSFAVRKIYVGGRWEGSATADFNNADYAEILVFNRGLTSAERQNVETYLATKYGLSTASSSSGATLTRSNAWSAAGSWSARLQSAGFTGVTVDSPSFVVTAGEVISAQLQYSATTISGGNVPIKIHWSDGTDSAAMATVTTAGTGTASITGVTVPGGVTTGKIRLAPSAAGTYDISVDAGIVVSGSTLPSTYSDTGLYPPVSVQIGTTIPGDAPALADLSLTNPTGGSTSPIWALLGWTKRPAAPLSGSVAPFGVIEAETGGTLSGFATSSDANYLSGSGLKVTASGAGTASALFTVDPSVMQPDDFTPTEFDVEVWARVSLDSTLVTPAMTVSLLPLAGSTFGGEQFSSEYGSTGKSLTLPASGTAKFRFVRLGTLSLPVDTFTPLKWNIKVLASWVAGSTGTFGLDYLVLVPARQRAVSPSGKANDSGYGKFIGSTGAATKTIRSDLSGLVASGSANPGRDSGLGGSPLELPPGNVDLLLKLSDLVADDPTSDATSEALSWSGMTGSLVVTPRYYLARGA